MAQLLTAMTLILPLRPCIRLSTLSCIPCRRPLALRLRFSQRSNPIRTMQVGSATVGGAVTEAGLGAGASLKQDSGSVLQKLSGIESSKRLAAYTAVDHYIKPEHRIIGIGSGSTVPYVVDRIAQQGKEVNKGRVFVPTGFQSRQLIVAAGLTLGDVDEYPSIDVTIDGADEVDRELNLIKGGGACHLREKVIAEAAETFVVVADYRKNSEFLGTNYAPGVPIEVVPFAYGKVLSAIQKNFGVQKATLRMAVKKAGPVVTDNGNFVIDAPFEREKMLDPASVLKQIKLLTGVVEVGLFCNMAKAAYFGNEDGTVTIRRADGTVEEVAGAT